MPAICCAILTFQLPLAPREILTSATRAIRLAAQQRLTRRRKRTPGITRSHSLNQASRRATAQRFGPSASIPAHMLEWRSVLKVLQNLLELQSVDVRLNDVRTRLAAFPKKITDLDARIAAAKAELEQSKAAQLATIKDRKKYELDVEQHKERVRKYRDQTAQIKTNEAYKALQHEVQMAEEEIAKAEDRLLEQMVAGEEYDRRVKASEKIVKETEETARGEKARIESDRASVEKELATVEAERARVVAGVP